MFLFTKYIKSATFNISFSQRTERILKLIFFSVWGIVFVAVFLILIQIANSSNLYFKSIKLKSQYQKELTINSQNEEFRKQMIEQAKNPPKGLIQSLNSANNGKPVSNKPTVTREFANSQSDYNPAETDNSGIDLGLWREVGIDNPNPDDAGMPDKAINKNAADISSGILNIVIILCIVFIFPWVIIRGFFWIKTADTTPASH